MIVPLQHVNSSLECDDDVWTEIRVSLSVKLMWKAKYLFHTELSKVLNENVS